MHDFRDIPNSKISLAKTVRIFTNKTDRYALLCVQYFLPQKPCMMICAVRQHAMRPSCVLNSLGGRLAARWMDWRILYRRCEYVCSTWNEGVCWRQNRKTTRTARTVPGLAHVEYCFRRARRGAFWPRTKERSCLSQALIKECRPLRRGRGQCVTVVYILYSKPRSSGVERVWVVFWVEPC